MEIGASFSSVWSFIIQILTYFFDKLDSITIGGVSLFVINLSLTVFLIVITATITVVRSGTVGSVGAVDRANASDKREAEKSYKDSYEYYYYNRAQREAYSKMYKDEHK